MQRGLPKPGASLVALSDAAAFVLTSAFLTDLNLAIFEKFANLDRLPVTRSTIQAKTIKAKGAARLRFESLPPSLNF